MLVTGTVLDAQTASTRTLGTPCSVFAQVPFFPSISLSAPPRLGTNPRLVYSGPNGYWRDEFSGSWSSSTAIMVLGLRNSQIPYGRCRIMSSAELVFLGVQNKPFQVTLSIPNDSRLLGFKLYAQAGCFVSGATCLLSCSTYSDRLLSAGLEITLGK